MPWRRILDEQLKAEFMKSLIALCLLLISSTCVAQVYKCAVSGKTIYSDIPCSISPERMNMAPSSGGFISAKKIAASDGPMDLSEAPIECKFKSYSYGDKKGKVLADNAKEECMRNTSLKKEGRGQEVSMEAYGLWKDHHQMESNRRRSSIPVNCVPTGFGGMRCN